MQNDTSGPGAAQRIFSASSFPGAIVLGPCDLVALIAPFSSSPHFSGAVSQSCIVYDTQEPFPFTFPLRSALLSNE
jgi:hypothetical protein